MDNKNIERLRNLLPEGSTVVVVTRSRTNAGLTLEAFVLVTETDGKLSYIWLSGLIADVCDIKLNSKQQLVSKGRGYDHSEDLVDKLSYALYRKHNVLFECDLN